MNTEINLPKNYAPSEFEDRIYAGWCEKGYFTPERDPEKKPFTIVIPPPNVTGQLHMGHALDETLQDILIRYKRMQGFSALWVPGTDHAGIATQIKVEENLRKNEGLTRYDLGREKFLERVWDWKKQYGDRIISQLKKLGSSCDWTRERFTMDEGCSKAVREVFVNLYNKGLIYRGNRIINWCPHCKTALSDAEVEYTEQDGHFWHIRYPFADGSGEVVIATTRPETMLGDTAVAVNPDDERYKDKIGKMLRIPLVNREIPLIADEHADKDYGTGCVKITPAHDPNDFEVGKRHDLPFILIMNGDGTINENGGRYAGMDRYEARKAIVHDLEEGGWLVRIEPHKHNVGTCYRCHNTVEPMTSNQWFVKMEPLAKPALDAVLEGKTQFVPERFTKIYTNWMENCHDWCISRQLWWGHRIPAYYCDKCGEMVVSKTDVDTCPKCGGKMRQEEDVLDTWFSSALWPFSTLGWPENTEDLKYFYPTNVLVTGYDIIFFWVARMIFSAIEHTGEVPFDHVFIHGLVRDEQGRKMSKSLGNGVDPLEIISKYGADALRYALVNGNSPGNDMRYSDKKVEAARNFANKLWNASRFAMMNLTITECELPDTADMALEDKWVMSKLNTLIAEVTANLDKYELGVALAKIYDFVWDVLCDWYIELIKPRLSEGDLTAQKVLCHALTTSLKLLHPFMPFITEEIFLALPREKGDKESIMISEWPKADARYDFASDEEKMASLIDAITQIRNRRLEMGVAPSKRAKTIIVTERTDTYNDETARFFVKLAGASEVVFAPRCDDESAVQIVAPGANIFIPLGELVDFAKERARLTKEREKCVSEIDRVDKKLANEGFVAKAPAQLIENEKAKRVKLVDQLASIDDAIAKFDAAEKK